MTFRNSLTLLLLLGSWPATAQAYCRTRTCDVDESCDKGNDGCSVGGKKAYWPNGCLTFAMQRDGSALQDISSRDAGKVAEDAFALWTNSECHRGGSPPLTFVVQDEVSCHAPEYNCDPKDWNANVIMFQDRDWPHDPSALAVTCVSMNLDTGEILDADMEINTTPPYFDFALPGDSEGDDLHMVIAHEAGHFLGLNHSMLEGAVMFANRKPDVLLSSLSDDDIAGICDIYGGKDGDPKCDAPELPSDTDCVGTSECVAVTDPEGCSCREGAPPGRGGSGALLALFAGIAAMAGRRRLA